MYQMLSHVRVIDLHPEADMLRLPRIIKYSPRRKRKLEWRTVLTDRQ